MPAGLQFWAPDGTQTLDISSDLLKVLGVASIGNSYTGAAASGSITDARLTAYANCVPFVQLLLGGLNIRGYYPSFTFVGNNLNWIFPRSGAAAQTRPDVTFLYGLW